MTKGVMAFALCGGCCFARSSEGAPYFDPMHIPYRDLDTWLDDQGFKASMKLKAIHQNFTFGPWDGESWLVQHKDTAADVAVTEAVDDPVLDFGWFRI